MEVRHLRLVKLVGTPDMRRGYVCPDGLRNVQPEGGVTQVLRGVPQFFLIRG